jgi:hypothetical protein
VFFLPLIEIRSVDPAVTPIHVLTLPIEGPLYSWLTAPNIQRNAVSICQQPDRSAKKYRLANVLDGREGVVEPPDDNRQAVCYGGSTLAW